VRFTSPVEHYDRFMGRYLPTLAPAFADFAGVEAGMRVVDVGCGPGGLTTELTSRIGGEGVAAIDPAEQFVAACRERNPEADVREGVAEELPWPDDAFDAAVSSLVVAFMRDADRGLGEMARVTRPGGTVAACMWDIAGGGMEMLSRFWRAVRAVGADSSGEQGRPGTSEGDLVERLRGAGLEDAEDGTLTAHAEYEGFDDFWNPFLYGVGPAGQHLRAMDQREQDRIRDALRTEFGDDPFVLEARAWAARGTVPGG
jgi:SAM-dependent methyltransferase